MSNQPTIVGLTVKEFRPMSKDELDAFGWAANRMRAAPMVIVLSDGTYIYPSSDAEHNNHGFLGVITPADMASVKN